MLPGDTVSLAFQGCDGRLCAIPTMAQMPTDRLLPQLLTQPFNQQPPPLLFAPLGGGLRCVKGHEGIRGEHP